MQRSLSMDTGVNYNNAAWRLRFREPPPRYFASSTHWHVESSLRAASTSSLSPTRCRGFLFRGHVPCSCHTVFLVPARWSRHAWHGNARKPRRCRMTDDSSPVRPISNRFPLEETPFKVTRIFRSPSSTFIIRLISYISIGEIECHTQAVRVTCEQCRSCRNNNSSIEIIRWLSEVQRTIDWKYN